MVTWRRAPTGCDSIDSEETTLPHDRPGLCGFLDRVLFVQCSHFDPILFARFTIDDLYLKASGG